MRIRNSIKLKSYKLNYLFSNDLNNKLKNNFLYQNLNSNYDLIKIIKQKNKNSTNLTEIKEVIPHNNNLLLTKSKSKLINIQNLTDRKEKNDFIMKKSSLNRLTKPKIKISNLMIKDFINDKSNSKLKYKTIINNTSINMGKTIRIKGIKKNLFNKEYLQNKNNKYLTLPKLKDSKTKKYSLSLYNKEKQRQKERYDEKLREKLLELEECEKKFDIEIYNTLSKLNEEEKRLYDS